MPFDPAPPLRLRAGDRKRLEVVGRKRTSPQRDVLRARILLLCADGIPHRQIKRELRTSVDTIVRWHQRYEQAVQPLRCNSVLREFLQILPILPIDVCAM